MIRVAGAPVSFGVFELTADRTDLPDPDALLSTVAQAGYEGIDLGPLGYFGQGAALRQRLRRHALGLAGAYVALRLSEADGFADDLASLDRTLAALEAAGQSPPWRPKPTLADAGSEARRAHPGRAGDLATIRLRPAGWRRLIDNLRRAVERCRERGFEPTFHHHLSSFVEAPAEIERLLRLTDVSLCLDTGHLLLAGGNPVRLLAEWGDRINHVHLKDARRSVLAGVIADRAGVEALWARGAFCELGSGDLDVEGFLAALQTRAYSGWLVVEQDRLAGAGEPLAVAAEAQARNRAFLRARGL